MLYYIPTPIGNIWDITLRALELFRWISVFFCEDTRTFRKLLWLYGISASDKELYAYGSFTNSTSLDKYKELLLYKDVWIVSEAWTPWLSDPWKFFIQYCHEYNIKFDILPGANALIPAVIWSAFDTSSFIFRGFIPHKKWKETLLKEIINSELPVFVYESVHRIFKTLKLIQKLWFIWKVSISREITKHFQQYICFEIDEIILQFESWTIPEKWEFVIWFYPYH